MTGLQQFRKLAIAGTGIQHIPLTEYMAASVNPHQRDFTYCEVKAVDAVLFQ